MQSYYPEFKQLMRDAGFPVTAGDGFAIEDLKWVLPFVASSAYNSGQPFNMAKAFAGTVFPSVLPVSLASQLSPGVFPNGVLWNNATKDGKGEWMLAGTGNPVNKWTISNTSSVQVGISPATATIAPRSLLVKTAPTPCLAPMRAVMPGPSRSVLPAEVRMSSWRTTPSASAWA